MRPSYLQEEYMPSGDALALQERMAGRNQELTDQRQLRSEESQRENNRMQVDGMSRLGTGIGAGVEEFVDKRQKGLDRKEETRRFDVQNKREQGRSDREAEEFGLRKPELTAKAETAVKRNDQEMKLMDAQTKGADANSRSAEVGATNAEKEMAWQEKPATGPRAIPGEINRDYVARMKMEGQEKELAQKDAELKAFVAEAPGRLKAQESTIASSNAATKAQNLANEKTKQDIDTDRLVAIARAPTNEQMQALGPHLVSEYNAGRLSPAQAGRVIGSINSSKLQTEVQNNLLKSSSPEFQAKFAELEKTKGTLRQSADGLVQMASALNQNKTGFFTDDQAVANFTSALRSMGRERDAIAIENFMPDAADVERGNVTKQKRMAAKLNEIAYELRSKPIDPELQKDPVVQNYMSVLTQMGNGNLGGQPTNLFGAPKQTQPAQAPGQFNINGQTLNFQGQGQPANPMGQAQPSPSARPRNTTAANFGAK